MAVPQSEKLMRFFTGMTFILVAAFFYITPASADSKTGADFLKIPMGARALGLGQAYSTLAKDSDALNWNVAGIVPAQMNSAASSLSLSHQELFFGNNLDHISLAIPRAKSSIGLSLTRLSYPKQEGRDAQRNETGNFSANDMAVGLALGTRLYGARVGTQLKFIRQQLASQESAGFAFDLGMMSRTPISKLQIGAAVKNLGPSMHFANDDYRLPLTISLGGAYQLSGPITVAMDLRTLPHQSQTDISFGTEIATTETITLRAGYLAKLASAITNNQKSETNKGSFGGLTGLNAGLGVNLSRFSLDYALSPFGELGNIHSFTLSTSFGGTEATPEISDDQPQPDPRRIIIFQ